MADIVDDLIAYKDKPRDGERYPTRMQKRFCNVCGHWGMKTQIMSYYWTEALPKLYAHEVCIAYLTRMKAQREANARSSGTSQESARSDAARIDK